MHISKFDFDRFNNMFVLDYVDECFNLFGWCDFSIVFIYFMHLFIII